MENENLNDLIVVKQLPVIEETLKNISTKIAEKVATATALVVNDDTIKEVKTARAELNKMKDELEAKRISVKNMVLKPYDDFEKVYKEYITEPFARADKDLKEKISNVENAQKEAKKEKILEYCQTIDFPKNSFIKTIYEKLRFYQVFPSHFYNVIDDK